MSFSRGQGVLRHDNVLTTQWIQ